jgi:hypothetical protein
MFLCEACSDMSEFHVTKKINKHTFTDYDRDLFYKHLTGYNFAAAGTSRRNSRHAGTSWERDNSAVPVHFRNIKHIKSPLLKLRYLWEVVFPGKEFMVEKYGLVSSYVIGFAAWLCQELQNTSQKSELKTQNWKLRFWWLWYPYRYYCGLRGLWLVITNQTKEQR